MGTLVGSLRPGFFSFIIVFFFFLFFFSKRRWSIWFLWCCLLCRTMRSLLTLEIIAGNIFLLYKISKIIGSSTSKNLRQEKQVMTLRSSMGNLGAEKIATSYSDDHANCFMRLHRMSFVAFTACSNANRMFRENDNQLSKGNIWESVSE